MIVKKFKLRDRLTKKYFHVIIYSSVKELNIEANKYDVSVDKEPYIPSNEGDEMLGVVHPYQRTKIFSDGSVQEALDIGIIRFTKKNLTAEIVSHEIVHAALWQYRLANKNGVANFGDETSSEEETFAEIYMRLFDDLCKKLYKHKLW